MKIVLTGATGFVGNHLMRKLVDRGDDVSILVRPSSKTDDVPNEVSCITIPDSQAQLEKIFEREQFDGVIHLASLYLMSHTSNDIETLINSNVTLGTKVIDAAAASGVSFFINTGSFAQHYESQPYSPTNLYAATKQAFQDITQYYAETTDLIILTIELFNTFGPGDTRSKIFTLWDKAIREDTTLHMSPGEQIIDISYIDNVVDAYVLAVEHATGTNAQLLSGRTYTIPSSERMTLKQLANVFAETVNGELKIHFGSSPYRERELMIPMEKGEALPDWTPKVSLREGIRRTFLDKY